MSEPSDLASGAGAANGHLARAGREQEAAAEAPAPADPWFEPAPKVDHGNGHAGAYDPEQTDWFLRTGRAGLLPDSMTESWEESGHAAPRPETSAAPPWAAEAPAPATDEPPPWESGPWPDPDEARPEWHPRPSAARQVRAAPADDTGNWQALAAVVTGVLPLVIPGAVLGVLGLRRARATGGTGRIASLAGIALSAVWAVILVVWLLSGGGSAASACGSYQNDVSYPVSQVLRDLSSGAPRSVLTSDLQQAISQANSAAAGAQQVTGRNAMSTLTSGLQQVLSEVGNRRAYSYSQMRQQVAADAAAMATACKS
ncbi:MAG TPA: DUF4190 domain-containing protein [Streptosporangiaceae bacterium]|nr:DUF4190 domain-containing protein [Streptosporangiaceae bacterium]